MLARNEAAQMAGVAEACEGLYDDWVILLDDRSSDDTSMSALEHLVGEGMIVEHSFADFAQARNRLFEVAREGLGEQDYLLLVDPDSPPRGTLPGLIHDWYECAWVTGGTEWRLPILVRATLECRYEGAAHELLILDDPGEAPFPAFADGLRVEVAPKEITVQRLESYLELLLPDATTNARSAYYLARTYRDLNRKGEALEAYLRCVQMTQWDEQVFCALIEAGQIACELDLEYGRMLFARAHKVRPLRGDGFYWIAWAANRAGEPEAAAAAAAEAIQLPPSSDRLFVNRWAEREGVLLELGLTLSTLNEREAREPIATMEA